MPGHRIIICRAILRGTVTDILRAFIASDAGPAGQRSHLFSLSYAICLVNRNMINSRATIDRATDLIQSGGTWSQEILYRSSVWQQLSGRDRILNRWRGGGPGNDGVVNLVSDHFNWLNKKQNLRVRHSFPRLTINSSSKCHLPRKN